MKRKLAFGALLGVLGAVLTASPAAAVADTIPDLPEDGATQIVLDNIFVLVAAVLVLMMQGGFALVEAGLTRAKSVANIMMKNLMDLGIGVVMFALVGFGIAFGSGNDFFGTSGFFLQMSDFADPEGLGAGFFGGLSLTVPTFFVFQVAFAATAATIVSGAMAERTQFKSYLLYSIVLTGFIYPVVVHWMWGGGWLAQRGFGDFAGSTIVHSTGGWAAMMGALILGPRLGKYGKDGKARPIPGHSMPFAILGVLILWVGWYGFNGGSELAADLSVPHIFLTTTLAPAAGAITAMITIWLKSGKPDVGMAGNGALAGLVSITAGTLTITPFWAMVVGAIGGVIVVFAVLFFDNVAKIDDPVGAISVHGVCGAWGTIAVGIFSFQDDLFVGDDKLGLIYGGGPDLLITQLIGVVAVFLFVTVSAGALFSAIKATTGLRVPPEEEIEGLDVVEHGTPGYAADVGYAGLSGSSGALSGVGAGRQRRRSTTPVSPKPEERF